MQKLFPSLHALSLNLPTDGSGEKRPHENTKESKRYRGVTRLQKTENRLFQLSSLITVDDADIEIDNTLPLAKRLVSNYDDIAPVEDDSDELKTLRDKMRVEVEKYKKSKANFEDLFKAVVDFTVLEIEESVENAINAFVDAAAEVVKKPLPDRLVSRDVVNEMREEPFFSYKLLMEMKDDDVSVVAHCPKASKTWKINKDTVDDTKKEIISFFVSQGKCVVRMGEFEREAFKNMLV
tara:strand:+ start:1491 stop:2201 length:711 start_codon:yes stop_codon:yes gene_type:complete